MGTKPRLSKTYWRLLAWVAAGAFLDWAMTVAAVGFMGFREMNPAWAGYFETGNYGVPLLFKAFSVLFLAIGFVVFESLTWREPKVRWAKAVYIADAIAVLCVVWSGVDWNSVQSVLYILGR